MTDAVLVLTTVPSEEEGQALAETLLEERLAACVNILAPMLSVYRWKGTMERSEERQVIIKTTRARAAAVQERIRTLHSYDVPECLLIGAEGGSEAYLRWIATESA